VGASGIGFALFYEIGKSVLFMST
jgi:hypothetical protein